MIKNSRSLRAFTLMLMLFLALPLFSEGVGFYTPPYRGYVSEEGTPYSYDECQAASSVYPIGTILDINGESVYVIDFFPGLPDRTILLNTYAAEKLGVLDEGRKDLEVEVKIETDRKETPTGWIRYRVNTYRTNQEAYDAILLLEHNGFSATAVRDAEGCHVYVNDIIAYKAESAEAKLKELGFDLFVRESEHNPYL